MHDKAITAFDVYGVTKDQALELVGRLKIETGQRARSWTYRILTRFNDPKANAIISKIIRDYNEPYVVRDLLYSVLVDRNRYDFLPDLKFLSEKLAKEKDVIKVAAANEMRREIKETIAALEKKKSEGKPIVDIPMLPDE